jgi:hypothetical protein
MYTFEFLLANRFPGVGMLSLWFLRIPKCKRASLFTNEILMELGRYHRLTIRRVDGMIGTVDRRKAFETLSGLVAICRTISTNMHGLRKDSTRATVNFDIYNEMVTGCGHLHLCSTSTPTLTLSTPASDWSLQIKIQTNRPLGTQREVPKLPGHEALILCVSNVEHVITHSFA